jgi:hypothetical protein
VQKVDIKLAPEVYKAFMERHNLASTEIPTSTKRKRVSGFMQFSSANRKKVKESSPGISFAQTAKTLGKTLLGVLLVLLCLYLPVLLCCYF